MDIWGSEMACTCATAQTAAGAVLRLRNVSIEDTVMMSLQGQRDVTVRHDRPDPPVCTVTMTCFLCHLHLEATS